MQHRYRLEALLGVGGFGAVYRARHVQMGNDVALKILHAEHCRDPRTVRRFELEAKRSAALKHPNTIRVFDFGPTEAGEFFIAMEYLEGQSLAAVLQDRAAMPPDRVVHILSQVLRSLDEAHLAGLVHRDLKPDNIYLLEIGHECDFVKVLDFGISKAARQESVMTTVGTLIGTPIYMSPEQCRGREIDGRSDLYSLGCIAFEMLTGRPPFFANDTLGYAVAHVHEPPPDVQAAAGPDYPIPTGLARWVMRLLEKDPDARFDDAVSALDALTTSLTGAATWEFDSPGASSPAEAAARGTLPRRKPTREEPAPLGTERARIASDALARGGKRGVPIWLWASLAGLAVIAAVVFIVWPRDDAGDIELTRADVEVIAASPASVEEVAPVPANVEDVAPTRASIADAPAVETAPDVVAAPDATPDTTVADTVPIARSAARSIRIESNTPATVYLDKEALGPTPFTLTFARDEPAPRVRVVAPGHRPLTVTFTTEDLERGALRVVLDKLPPPRPRPKPPDPGTNIPSW